jgi:hypothetical protein
VKPVVEKLETVSEATRFCAAHLPGDLTPAMIQACGEALVGKTDKEATSLLSGSLVDVLNWLGLGDLLLAVEPPCQPLPGHPCN